MQWNLKGCIAFSLIISFTSLVVAQENRNIDGYNNNIENKEWGTTNSPLKRLTPNVVSYANGIDEINTNFPNPREISNKVFSQFSTIEDESRSDFVWSFGQFLSHDISLVETGSEISTITVPADDNFFPGGSSMYVSRDKFIEGTGVNDAPRQYENTVTAFIDASNVYGSGEDRASWLRRNDESGKLKTSNGSHGDLLPWNTVDGQFNSAIDVDAPFMDDNDGHLVKFYVAGDVRANENLLLLSMHTLFVREHNRLCDEIAVSNPSWSGEEIYQRARKLVGAYIQKITYEDWLTSMGVKVSTYSGYDNLRNPEVSNDFSAAAFRLGHTLLSSEIVRLKNNGEYIDRGNIPLDSAFFNPIEIELGGGIDSYFKGMATQFQQKMDCKVINDVRNFLFGAPGQGGLDLAAVNILRGRDRGLPTFTQLQSGSGFPVAQSFYQITQNDEEADDLASIYGDVSEVDAWVGLLGEKPENGAMMGKMIMYIIRTQFEDLRDRDRFYFENDPALTIYLDDIRNTSLHDIIMRNSNISIMQKDVFEAMPHQDIVTGPELKKIHLEAAIYPNPVTSDDGNTFIIKLHSDYEGIVTIHILNSLGSYMNGYEFDVIQGDNFIEMELDYSTPRGMYSVLIESKEYSNTLKLIKH